MTDTDDVTAPVHVAIIMDGNGRWAKSRGLPRVMGHRRGADAVRRTVETAGALGISYLTLFGFSSENWKRPKQEIGDLMGLLRLYLSSEMAELHRKNVRLRMIGDRSQFEADIIDLIEDVERMTAENSGLTLVLALSYGGRQEIAAAMRSMAREVAEKHLDPADIDVDTVSGYLLTADIPDPDLLIRTSGEQRISNFLLWQLAYTEFVFLDTLWPDFSTEDFRRAISEFNSRERRYGAAVGPA
ncbi:MAG: isoprenyl transferase [Alphaproteobacteria bacterium]|nr:isoprenyl transferase [Alphaproteobacteria bacterium]